MIVRPLTRLALAACAPLLLACGGGKPGVAGPSAPQASRAPTGTVSAAAQLPQVTAPSPVASPASPSPSARGPQAAPASRPPTPVQTLTLGRSVQGRPITAVELGDPTASRRLLVVGCIHGDEPAGIAIARQLEHVAPPAGTDVWVIENLNPDGTAAGTRQNADGVDLNRNFPSAWQPLESPGGLMYSGPAVLSEPESKLAVDFLNRVRPTVSIWYHQHEDLVDLSGGDASLERRYAAMVGLRAQQLPRYPGSVTSWENQAFPGRTAFVVELRAGSLSEAAADRYAVAALRVV